MLETKQLMEAIYFHSIESNSYRQLLDSSFVFMRITKLVQV